jgi:hypothetical protein
MTTIVLKTFDGMYPVVNSRLLKDSAAQVALNTKITGGSLAPYGAPTTAVAKRSAGNPVTIYRFGQSEVNDTQYWFEFTSDTDVVRGPVAGDTTERTFYSSATTEPRMTYASLVPGAGVYPNASYRLGIPPPTSAPTLTAGAGGGGNTETRYYCYTFVSALGEEGPPSAVTSISVLYGQTVTVSGMSASPSGPYNINRKRIYRTVTGSQATDFQFVGEVAAATGSLTDNVGSAQLGELLATDGHYPPRSSVHNEPGGNAFNPVVVDPSPFPLRGLTMMANGIMAGFAGNIICFSEPFMPHAWKRENELTTDYPIVATKGFGGQSLAVLTTAYPYIVVGTDPSAMSMAKLDELEACASKRSAVAMAGGVIYASPNGLVRISQGTGAQVITRGLFTRTEWQAYKPDSIHAYTYDGRYIAFYDNGTTQGCLIFSFNGQEPALTISDVAATAGFMEPLTGRLYLMQGSNITRFDAGSATTLRWRSKLFTLDEHQNLGWAQVIAKTYPLTFRVFGYDSTYTYTVSVADPKPFRLPAAIRYRSVEVEVEGTREVEQILISSSMSELRSV